MVPTLAVAAPGTSAFVVPVVTAAASAFPGRRRGRRVGGGWSVEGGALAAAVELFRVDGGGAAVAVPVAGAVALGVAVAAVAFSAPGMREMGRVRLVGNIPNILPFNRFTLSTKRVWKV